MYKRLKCVLAIVSLGIILVGCQMNNEEKSPKNETKTSKHVSHQKMTKK
ncbi:lipoprotein BUG3, partial [Streptococcus iniae]